MIPRGMREYLKIQVSESIVYGDMSWVDDNTHGLVVLAEWDVKDNDGSMWITYGKFVDPDNVYINNSQRVGKGFFGRLYSLDPEKLSANNLPRVDIVKAASPRRKVEFLSLLDTMMFEQMWPKLWDEMGKRRPKR